MSYYDRLRRFSAILLLALFSFSLLSAALGAPDPDANLPACCRRNGKHHCSMSMGGGSPQSGAGFHANDKCPMYPGVVLSAAGPIALQVPSTVRLNVPDHSRMRGNRTPRGVNLRVLRDEAHLKRGPPAFILS
jgi:hypothetical protein